MRHARPAASACASRPSAAARCSALMPWLSRASRSTPMREQAVEQARPAQAHRQRQRRVAGRRRRRTDRRRGRAGRARSAPARARPVRWRRRRRGSARGRRAPAGDTPRRAAPAATATRRGRGRAGRTAGCRRWRRGLRRRRRAPAASRSGAAAARASPSCSSAPSSAGDSRRARPPSSAPRPSLQAFAQQRGGRAVGQRRIAASSALADRGRQRVGADRARRPAASGRLRRRGRPRACRRVACVGIDAELEQALGPAPAWRCSAMQASTSALRPCASTAALRRAAARQVLEQASSTSAWPPRAASSSGVRPGRRALPASAPAASSASTISTWPAQAASCSALRPSPSRASTLALCLSSSCTPAGIVVLGAGRGEQRRLAAGGFGPGAALEQELAPGASCRRRRPRPAGTGLRR